MITAFSSMQNFFQKQERIKNCELDYTVSAFLSSRVVDLEELIESKSIWHAPLSNELIVNNWKSFLNCAMINYLSPYPSKSLSRKVHELLNQPWNQQSQYLKTLIALSQFLTNLTVIDLHFDSLEGGAIPVQEEEYCPWNAGPFQPDHCQMGVYLILLFHFSKSGNLKKKLIHLVEWQLNLLDFDFKPIRGLFVREKMSSSHIHLIWNYLLFYSMSKLVGESKYHSVAEKLLQHIQDEYVKDPFTLSPEIPLVEKIIESVGKGSNKEMAEMTLSEKIEDSSMALGGIRKKEIHVACTLHGSGTGMGYYRYQDAEVVNFGPHYLPLEEADGFGIQGNYLSEQGIRKTRLDNSKGCFFMQGCVRMIDKPLFSSSLGQLRGIWMEVEQGFKEGELTLKSYFLGFEGWDDVAFCFYVKGKSCYLDGNTRLLPRTFNNYKGEVKTLLIEGKQGSIELHSTSQGVMQVIPLGGQESFWGADFLIAYLLDSNEREYRWILSNRPPSS